MFEVYIYIANDDSDPGSCIAIVSSLEDAQEAASLWSDRGFRTVIVPPSQVGDLCEGGVADWDD